MKRQGAGLSLRLAAPLLAVLAGPALAGPAVLSGDVNVRSGPGTRYAVVGTLPQGIQVNVVDCTATWCRVEGAGPAYIHGRYLTFPDGATAFQPPSPVVYEYAASPVVIRRQPVIVLSPPALALPPTGPDAAAASGASRVFYPPLLTYKPTTYWRW